MYGLFIIVCSLSLIKAESFTFKAEIIPSNSSCTPLKEKFANSSAQFNLCAIRHSRPIRMCEKCHNEYLDVQNSYKNLSEVFDNGTSCLEKYINFDRLQIVSLLYQNNVNLWNNAKCEECYDKKNGNMTIADEFGEYFNNFINCVNKTKDDLCSVCMKYYVQLDHYFRSVSDVNDKIGVCMDIVDVMNTTWTFWSVNCCNYRRHDEFIFIGSTIAVLLITVSFYVILQFCKEKNAPTIIQQSRFFESLNQ
ncbi:osteopetrosis-associated transmembrane protein 1 [Diorhabda carinulata]|uniref:osteopetrosis-associated transmembrane protein 1 n=1 Tax=Diorhabda carinulata TaxID=1163345 RepID=UPI0025A23AC0|nr:osteopetrosis-associated transmembrane protein 1 [Diorhabda carinulata]